LGCKDQLRSVIETKDPKVEQQLLEGFHQVEDGTWRWTMQEFAVLLRAPPGAAERGAELRVTVAVPEVLLQRLGASTTLSCKVNEIALTPETYTKPGKQEFHRPVAPFAGPVARLACRLDKALPPDPVDARERGIVAHGFALLAH
jgi:hypothetical protein